VGSVLQMRLFGGMLSFNVVGGEKEAFCLKNNLQQIVRATSLGATETLIEHRRSVEATPTSPPNLLRLSVGIEHVEDLLADLEQALRTL
jgi:cystathionine gamma-synthase